MHALKLLRPIQTPVMISNLHTMLSHCLKPFCLSDLSATCHPVFGSTQLYTFACGTCLCDDLQLVLLQTTRLWADAQGTGTSGLPFKNDGATVVANQPQPQLEQKLAASLRLASSHSSGSSRQDHIHLFKNHAREGGLPCLHELVLMLPQHCSCPWCPHPRC